MCVCVCVYVFRKCVFQMSIFRKCIFQKCISENVYFPKVYFPKVYCKYASILGPNFFDPRLKKPRLLQTERIRWLAHLPSFCELVHLCTTSRSFDLRALVEALSKALCCIFALHEMRGKNKCHQQKTGMHEVNELLSQGPSSA